MLLLPLYIISDLLLVQEPGHVRITDFGLSKLLDHNENVVTYTGGKV